MFNKNVNSRMQIFSYELSYQGELNNTYKKESVILLLLLLLLLLL
jgi:hypothetical protein